nr:hypothetical protein [uncultured Campylobacter sp.]
MSSALQDVVSQTLTEQKACARAFNRYRYLSIAAFFAVLFVLVYLEGVETDTPSVEIAEFLGVLILFPIFWIFFLHCAGQKTEAEIRYYKFYKEIFVRAVINDIDAGLKYDPYTAACKKRNFKNLEFIGNLGSKARIGLRACTAGLNLASARYIVMVGFT